MSNKRFSRSLSEQYDPLGKRLAAEIMGDIFSATLDAENTKETSGDFSEGFWDHRYRLSDGQSLLVEPEMKDKKWWGTGWDESRPFKYDTMDIPFRKKKNKADIFMVISTCERYAWIVWRAVVDQHLKETGGKPKNKVTIYEPDGGDYYSTPVAKGIFVHKQDGKWRRWKGSTNGDIRCTA
jgi:hypothetical protein